MPTFIYKETDTWRVDAVMLHDGKKAIKWVKKKLPPNDYFIGMQEIYLNSRFALDLFRRKFGHDLNPGISRGAIEQLLAERPKSEIVFHYDGKDISASEMVTYIDDCSEIAVQYSLALYGELRKIKTPLVSETS